MDIRELKCKVVSVGAWGGFFENWNALQALLNNGELPEKKAKGPKPAVIPANERRRAPLPVRLAVESSLQATDNAGVAPDQLTCVFDSSLGDTELTDYMCKVLASDNKELSPTKFHSSVHNAAAGYWTISTKTMSAANSVAGFENSVSLTLLEAMVQCESEGVPMLVTFYDAPVSKVLEPLLHNQEAFAFSLVLYPSHSDVDGRPLSATIENTQPGASPTLVSQSDYIQSLYEQNPCARILCLAELLGTSPEGSEQTASINMPLSEGSTMSLQLS